MKKEEYIIGLAKYFAYFKSSFLSGVELNYSPLFEIVKLIKEEDMETFCKLKDNNWLIPGTRNTEKSYTSEEIDDAIYEIEKEIMKFN